MKQFDIVLVLDYFRSASAFLSVITHFSPTHTIGLCQTPGDPALMARNAGPHKQFVDECVRLGARLIGDDESAVAQLMIVQQRVYPDDVAAGIMSRIHAERRAALMNFAMAGIALHDRFLKQFRIDSVYIPSRRFMDFLLERRGAREMYASVDVHQVGLPYAKTRLFPDFEVDYLIAAPTPFSFKREIDKHAFLESVQRLLDAMPSSATVAYKPHNASARDYFAPPRHSAVGRVLARIPGTRSLLRAIARGLRGRPKLEVERVLTSVMHERVMRRVVTMESLTPYAYVSLEAFLPGVKRGVIGGLSNTIWGTLYFGLPFYNCVDEDRRARTPAELLAHKDPSNFLDLNIQFFGVPCCHGDLGKGAQPDSVVIAADREGDLFDAIGKDLAT